MPTEFEQRRQAMIAKINADIEHSGFSMIGVFAGHNTPAFTYTIGLTQKGFPEMICVGLDARHIGGVWNAYYDELITGQREELRGVSHEFFNLPVAVIEADPKQCIDNYAHSTGLWCEANGLTPRFVQWVWSDKAGKLPWESGWDTSFNKMQPLLGNVEHLRK